MSCVPGFDELMWVLGLFVFSAAFLYGLLCVDNQLQLCDKERIWMLWLAACLAAAPGFYICVEKMRTFPKFCFLALAIYLVVSSVTDILLCQVHDVLQYFGAMNGVALLLYRMPEPKMGVSLVVFTLIQYFLFLKMYGGADGMAFLICALYLASLGKGLESYLFHMALCYLLLAVVQGLRKNINKQGNLKEPVALLPYIGSGLLPLLVIF